MARKKNEVIKMTVKMSEPVRDKLTYVASQRGQNMSDAIRFMIIRDYEILKHDEQQKRQEKGSD